MTAIRLVDDDDNVWREGALDEDFQAALDAVEALPEREAPPPALSPIAAQWARYRDDFAEAMVGGPYRIEDLERQVFAGEVYFWPGRAAAVTAKRVFYPSGEAYMETLWAVGDLAEVIAMAPGIEAAARLVGCSAMLVEGRKGWEKILKPHGYEPWSVTLKKAL